MTDVKQALKEIELLLDQSDQDKNWPQHIIFLVWAGEKIVGRASYGSIDYGTAKVRYEDLVRNAVREARMYDRNATAADVCFIPNQDIKGAQLTKVPVQ